MIVASSIHYPAILSSYNPSKKETAANRPPFPYYHVILFSYNPFNASSIFFFPSMLPTRT
jgi:hypothetical protein